MRMEKVVRVDVSPYFASAPLFGTKPVAGNFVYCSQGVPYGSIPEGTPRVQNAVTAPNEATFRVSQASHTAK
jgi:hypothetical protein